MGRTDHKVVTTKHQLERALSRARRFAMFDRHVVTARYEAANDRVCLSLRDGIEICIPRSFLQGLESSSKAQLSHIEVVGNGSGLHWPDLDVDHYIPGLLDGIFGTKRWMSQLGRRGGISTSPAKAAAARVNGRKGGRPRNLDRKGTRPVHRDSLHRYQPKKSAS